MNTFDIAIPVVIAGLVWLWFDSSKAREAGTLAVRKACEIEGLQLLDETIALASMRPERNAEGWLSWRRRYQFEYSDTGDNRRRGSVELYGQRVTMINEGLRAVSARNVSRFM